MTTHEPADQELTEILGRRTSQPFEGSGCSEHVRRRNLVLSVLGAVALVVVLVVLLII